MNGAILSISELCKDIEDTESSISLILCVWDCFMLFFVSKTDPFNKISTCVILNSSPLATSHFAWTHYSLRQVSSALFQYWLFKDMPTDQRRTSKYSNIRKNLRKVSGRWKIDYCEVSMSVMASQIISLKIVYPTVHLGAVQRKHQSSASLAFVWGVARKMFPFDDVIMW